MVHFDLVVHLGMQWKGFERISFRLLHASMGSVHAVPLGMCPRYLFTNFCHLGFLAANKPVAPHKGRNMRSDRYHVPILWTMRVKSTTEKKSAEIQKKKKKENDLDYPCCNSTLNPYNTIWVSEAWKFSNNLRHSNKDFVSKSKETQTNGKKTFA